MTIYMWPQNPDGSPKSLGEMSSTERVRAEGAIFESRIQKDLMFLTVMSFLERQVMIAMENLARGIEL